VVVTGGAGFIGSNLVDGLLAGGYEVVVLDDLSTGVSANLQEAHSHERFHLIELDLLDDRRLAPSLEGAEVVFHLAAHADVRFGWDNPRQDLDQNIIVTVNLLEAMREAGVRRLIFGSSGSVYGNTNVIPTPEDVSFPVQTSLYGASKLAAEGYIAAYAEAGHVTATVLRLVSILGARYSHGHVIDFVRQLSIDPGRLNILGNGAQRKSYLDVEDCVAAMTSQLTGSQDFEIFNLGADEYCTVRDSVSWICDRMGVAPELVFDERDRGWIGDNPFIYLDTARIRATGWSEKHSIRQAVERTVDYLLQHPDRVVAHDLRIPARTIDHAPR
jgi:UDP-glucose 4-epimerase